jgi:predicted GNAT family acetyltransferase
MAAPDPSNMPETFDITHDPAAGRFEIRTPSGTALLHYVYRGADLEILHTEVPDEMEGHGYGAALARAALDFARREQLKVIPSCPFVSAYIRRHPEDAELVAAA